MVSISDIIDMTKNLQVRGYLVTLDIKKALNTFNHNFLITQFNIMQHKAVVS